MATTKAKAEPEEAPERTQLIINQKRVDKFNTICNRIEFTPAVCDICGFDVCGANDLGSYWDMTTEMQDKVKKALEKHVKEAHSQASQNIIYADELPQKWLGKAREDASARKKAEFGEDKTS